MKPGEIVVFDSKAKGILVSQQTPEVWAIDVNGTVRNFHYSWFRREIPYTEGQKVTVLLKGEYFNETGFIVSVLDKKLYTVKFGEYRKELLFPEYWLEAMNEYPILIEETKDLQWF
jgi:hypothetical protein